jgi:phosphoadenosine phosphosulfate reductase
MTNADRNVLERSRHLHLTDFLRFLTGKFDRIAFSTSLGMEDQVISHHIFSNDLPIRVFTLDTWRMFDETYEVLEATRRRYGKPIEVYHPDRAAVERLEAEKGKFSFYESVENRKECCYIRKVEPLRRALANTQVWITGLRAEQSANRRQLDISEWDNANGVMKVHPIIDWSWEDLLAEVKRHDIPYNPLHNKGFVSIGCAPCTRAIREGEDFRAGRWWWEESSKKECGLHQEKHG